MNENGYDAASLVCLPRHEYARLVAAKAKLDVVEKVVNKMDSYAAYPVLKLLFPEEDAKE
jgi:hypothetical protein